MLAADRLVCSELTLTEVLFCDIAGTARTLLPRNTRGCAGKPVPNSGLDGEGATTDGLDPFCKSAKD